MPNKPPQCELLRVSENLSNENLPVEQRRAAFLAICGGCAIEGWVQAQVHDWPPHEDNPHKVVVMGGELPACPMLPDLQGNGVEYIPPHGYLSNE